MSRQRVEFINLRQAGSDALGAAARLAAHHHEQGRRVLILARDAAEAEEMDRRLWTFDEGSFVPHALAGGPEEGREPVLIAHQPGNPNQAEALILLHHQDPLPGGGFALLILLLPQEEGPELKACRALYAKLREAGQVEVVHETALP